MHSAIAVIACVLTLVLVNVSIVNKERLLADGRVVYLELAPVDPRSLMQGDYMALRFRIADSVRPALKKLESDRGGGLQPAPELETTDGCIVAALDERLVAGFQRLDDGQPLAANEVKLCYRVREGGLRFATNAFFFQEGHATLYEAAVYGEFRVTGNGDLLLTGLRGKDLQRLGPTDPAHLKK